VVRARGSLSVTLLTVRCHKTVGAAQRPEKTSAIVPEYVLVAGIQRQMITTGYMLLTVSLEAIAAYKTSRTNAAELGLLRL
jgi:hypothetical protein